MTELAFLSKSTRLTNYSAIPNELFSLGLSSTATILYAKLINRANLSINNVRMDENGRIYILYRLEDLSTEIGRSISPIKENMNELVAAGLVEKRRADKGRANLIFVKVPVSSIADGKPPIYGTESKPYIGAKCDCSRGGFPTTNNNKSNRDKKPNYIYGEDAF